MTIILNCGTVENCHNICDKIEKKLCVYVDVSKMPEGDDITLLVDTLRRNVEVSFSKNYFYTVYSSVKDVQLDGNQFE